MPLIVAETPGAANANAYLSLAEYLALLDARLRVIAQPNADTNNRAIVMATAAMDRAFSAREARARASGSVVVYQWTGSPTDDIQALAWPRDGMFTRNGFAIPNTEIPADLKAATGELAYQLQRKDLLATNAQIATGLTAIKAGSLQLNFKDGLELDFSVLPDAVLSALVPSWYTPDMGTFPIFEFEAV